MLLVNVLLCAIKMEELPRREEEEIEVPIYYEAESGSTPTPTLSDDSESDLESHYSSNDDPLIPMEDLDLATIILNEIKDETYVCLICTSEVGPYSRTWDCKMCYRVYHVSCINNWSKKGSSTDANGDWKCPHCSGVHHANKIQYKCWCGKVIDPARNNLNPGSCGQSCGVRLQGCPHSCTLPCHPGPHTTCNALGPPMRCHCGNHQTQWPCVLTPYAEGWKCEDVCEEYLPCEIHKCNKLCHDGLCGKCEEFTESTCYCGSTTDSVKCHLRVPMKSVTKDKSREFIGNFKCPNSNDQVYDCGIHSDSVPCKPRHKKDPHCPLSPDVIKHCPCGQTSIIELNNGENRQSCADPIPTCSKICNKRLSCGHNCKNQCHEGEYLPCYEFIKTKCSCGFNSFIVPCKFLLAGNTAKCSRKCSALLSCRRHRCNKICCAEEGVSMMRERERKKALRKNQVNMRNSNEAFGIEATHICLKVCEKKLSCGNPEHTCQRTCHTGPCPPCLESTNDDLICNCGQTVVLAPIRCGTTLPPCESQCIRERSCGHPPMPHNCHPDDVECPKCTRSVKKTCVCGKSKVWGMCYQEEVFCVAACDKPLPCGHRCLKTCHKEGECGCTSICGIRKRYCSHVDRHKCHYPEPCKDEKVCNQLVAMKCKCGRKKQEVPCGASFESSNVEKHLLDCDISCVLQEREDKLREAFGVVAKDEKNGINLKDLPYAVEALKIASAQLRWCSTVEKILIEFMKSDKKSFSFKPMKPAQREFVHLLSEAFGLYSESQDPEPYRSVYVLRRPTSKVPEYSLSQAIPIYQKIFKSAATKVSKPSTNNSSTNLSREFTGAEKNTNTNIEQQASRSHTESNAILIQDCIVGVTRSDLEDAIMPVIATYTNVKHPILKWIVGDEYLVIPDAFMRLSQTSEKELKHCVQLLRTTLKEKFLANTVKLVQINEYYSIVKESVEEKGVENKEANTHNNTTELVMNSQEIPDYALSGQDAEGLRNSLEETKDISDLYNGGSNNGGSDTGN